jgi:NitT/TauT family transport system permease protein
MDTARATFGPDPGVPALGAAAFEEEVRAETRTARQRFVTTAWVLRIAALLVFLGTWEFLAATNIVKPFYISDPPAVAAALVSILSHAETWYNIWQTFAAAAVSLVVGSLLGIAGGMLLWRVPVLARAFNPYVTLCNSLPRPALAPLFIMWFGLGVTAKVFVAVTIVFFVLLVNTMVGLSTVDPDIMVLSNSLGVSRLQRFLLVELPSALPSVLAGLRLGAVYAVLGVVVSEVVASYYGLGQLLVKATNGFQISTSFAVIALMAAMAIVLDMGTWLLQRQVQLGGSTRRGLR